MNAESDPAPILFLDANVPISAAWKEGSEIALIWRMAGMQLVTSDHVMGEVQRNLIKIDQIERLRGLMRSVKVVPLQGVPVIAEAAELAEKDRQVLAAAIQVRASHLVSGDKRHFGPWYGKVIHGVRITAPSELLTVFRRRLP